MDKIKRPRPPDRRRRYVEPIAVPIGKKMAVPDGAVPAPRSLSNRMPQIPGNRVEDIAHIFGGRAAKVKGPIFLYGPQGQPVIIIATGHEEAAEIEDLAINAMNKPRFNFEEARERRGLPDLTKARELFQEALADSVRRQRQNPRTTPVKVRRPPNPTNKTVHSLYRKGA